MLCFFRKPWSIGARWPCLTHDDYGGNSISSAFFIVKQNKILYSTASHTYSRSSSSSSSNYTTRTATPKSYELGTQCCVYYRDRHSVLGSLCLHLSPGKSLWPLHLAFHRACWLALLLQCGVQLLLRGGKQLLRPVCCPLAVFTDFVWCQWDFCCTFSSKSTTGALGKGCRWCF